MFALTLETACALTLVPGNLNGKPETSDRIEATLNKGKDAHNKHTQAGGNYSVDRTIQDSVHGIKLTFEDEHEDWLETYMMFPGARRAPLAALFQGTFGALADAKHSASNVLEWQLNLNSPSVVQEVATAMTEPVVQMGASSANERAASLQGNAYLNELRMLESAQLFKESRVFVEAFYHCMQEQLKNSVSYIIAQSTCMQDRVGKAGSGGIFERTIGAQAGFNFRQHPANYKWRSENESSAQYAQLEQKPWSESDRVRLSELIFVAEARELEQQMLLDPLKDLDANDKTAFTVEDQMKNYHSMMRDMQRFFGDVEWRLTTNAQQGTAQNYIDDRGGLVRWVPSTYTPGEYFHSRTAEKLEDIIWMQYRHCKLKEILDDQVFDGDYVHLIPGTSWDFLQGFNCSGGGGAASSVCNQIQNLSNNLLGGGLFLDQEQLSALSLPGFSFSIGNAQFFWKLFTDSSNEQRPSCDVLSPVHLTGIMWPQRLKELRTDAKYNTDFFRTAYSFARLVALGEILMLANIIQDGIQSTTFSIVADDSQREMAEKILSNKLGDTDVRQSLQDVVQQLRDMVYTPARMMDIAG